MPAMQGDLQHMLGQLMAAQPESVPILRNLFAALGTRGWTSDVPASVMGREGAAMAAMHRAMERGDYAGALARLRVWAGLLGVTAGDAAPE